MPRVSNAFKVYTSLKPLIENKHDNFFIMLELNSSMFVQKHSLQLALQKWEPAGRICDFGNFFKGLAKARASIVLNIEWVQFELQNCEILHSVRGLYDKNSTS